MRCFVVGNGPSLKDTPFELLAGETTFACNRIARLYDKTTWRPSYFLATTHLAKDPRWLKDMLVTIEMGIPSFIWIKLYHHFVWCENSNICWIKCHNDGVYTEEPPDEWWSDDIKRGFSKFGGSAAPMMQAAAYMGYNKIGLLGMDANWKIPTSDKDPNHFDEEYGHGSNPNPFRVKWWNAGARISHDWMHRATEQRGIEVYNCTPGSGINAYPRLTIEEFLGND